MISDASFLAIIGAGIAFLALIAKLLYSSKCEYVKCCCLEVKRNVVEEPSLRNITSQV
jgi:hypothetical protein